MARGGNGDGRSKERAREETGGKRESRRDPNNPSRSEENRVGRAVGSCATALRSLFLSQRLKNIKRFSKISILSLSTKNMPLKNILEAFLFSSFERKAKVRLYVHSYVRVYTDIY